MLSDLAIKNVAVIDSLNISFKKGMSVLTGETGAGKSIIIDSINMILGDRTNKGLVRYGEDKASVQAVFDDCCEARELLSQYDIETEDEQLVISRQITSQGKSVCRINGVIVPLSILRDIADRLINIHGQHDNQALLTPSKHIVFLDNYAGDVDKLNKYKSCYRKVQSIKDQIDSLRIDEQEKARRIDLLEYQISEIEKAELTAGEDTDLQEQRSIMENAEMISSKLNEAYDNIYGGSLAQAAYDAVSIAVSALSELTDYDAALKELYENLTSAMYTIEDAAHEIKDYAENVEFDEAVLNDIEDRLDLILKLKRKYGGTIEEILAFKDSAKKELEDIQLGDEKIAELEKDLLDTERTMLQEGKALTEARKKAAVDLQKLIEEALHELDMEKAKFMVMLKSGDPHSNGMDEVEFLFSANLGEPLKPLVKIASGGELSRVMLAMKSVLADSDNVDTLIFDEIDTGVSGRAAQKIAKKLAQIAANKQVICITHLPQLSSVADNHYLIEKHVENERTFTAVKMLDDEERIKELARMIDGTELSETALLHAKELLSKRGREI